LSVLSLDNVSVSIDPATIAADAVRCLFEVLGARVNLQGRSSDVDIVIASNSPQSLDVGKRAWVVVTGSHSVESSMTREALREPSLGFGPVAEMLTAAHAVLVALAILYRSGPRRGPAIARISMLEVMGTCLADLLLPALCQRAPQPRRSTAERTLVIPCADGSISITLTNADARADLASMTGIEALLDSVETSTRKLLEPWTRARSRNEIVEIGQSWRLPILPVMGPDEVERAGGCPVPRPFRVTDVPPASAQQGQHDQCCQERYGRLPLSGVRVLDLGMVWSGPYCGRLLAGLGAEVIKVEGPRRRDGTRPTEGWHGCSGLFADLNRGKKSLVLDLATDEGRAAFIDLTRNADVVLENFSPRVMLNFHLDYGTLSSFNRSLVQLSLPGFESDGPFGQFVSYGSGLELATGLGLPRPGRMFEPAPVPYLDMLAGVYGAIGIVGALLRREVTGTGLRVEVAQQSIAQHFRFWCPDDLWSATEPTIDPEAVAHNSDLLPDDFFTSASDDGYCRHLARCPWWLSDSATPDEATAPGFGADSAAVLRDVAGLSSEAIRRLIKAEAVVDSSIGLLTGIL
jgi:crotonobetainyl-CoA:carnitine CoA-transferase CaiB-like acyl-CoA transferase